MQRVNIDEEHIIILIDKFDGLVQFAILVNLHQAAEAPHAVVDMHHIVAHLQSVEFRYGHLLIALDLAIDTIATIAVKYLMIGVEAYFQTIIHKALVQRYRHSIELYTAASHLVEDIIQTLDLRPILREDIGSIPLQHRIRNIISQHLKVFVELGLWRGCKRDCHVGHSLCNIIALQAHAACSHISQQRIATCNKGIYLRGLLHFAQQATTQIIDTLEDILRIIEPAGSLAGKAHERHLLHIAMVKVGDNLHLVGPVVRQLARNIETAYRVYLIAKEIKTEWTALRIREDIDNTSTQRVLPRLIDKIDLLETSLDQLLLQRYDAYAIAHPQTDAALRESTLIGYTLGYSLGICADHRISLAVVAQSIERIGTLHHSLRILAAIEYRTFIRRREEVHPLLIEQGIEVVEHICCRITILRNEDMHTTRTAHQSRRIERKSPADQIVKMDGDALFTMFFQQRTKWLRSLDTLQDILYTLHDAEIFFLISPLNGGQLTTLQAVRPPYRGISRRSCPGSGRQ